MNPYVLRNIEKEDLTVFKQIKSVIEAMPEMDLTGPEKDERGGKILISCHMLGRALAHFFPVTCKDGYYFSRGWRHSWLETKNGHVIDHYPWGTIGGPVLIGNHFNIPGFHLYHEARVLEVEGSEFLSHTVKVTKVVGETIEKLGIIVGQ